MVYFDGFIDHYIFFFTVDQETEAETLFNDVSFSNNVLVFSVKKKNFFEKNYIFLEGAIHPFAHEHYSSEAEASVFPVRLRDDVDTR